MFGLFGKKDAAKEALKWDPEKEEPVVHKSICTGETTVGFVDRATGKYHDVRKVTTPAEIALFCEETGVEPGKIRTIY